jgi:hypothetical protein
VSSTGAGHLEEAADVARPHWPPAGGRLARCFLLGAVLGTLLDGIHAYGDVLSYPDPAFGRWAWFVPLEFGLLGVAAGLLAPAIERRLPGDAIPQWTLAQRLAEAGLFTGLYLSTALIEPGGAVALAIALAALALFRLFASRTPGDWLYVLAAAVLGPAAEAIISAAGAFDYAEPDFAGIPVWLPALWANAGFVIRRLVTPIVIDQKAADRS